MKSSLPIHFLWALAVASAFLAGTLMDRSSASPVHGSSHAATPAGSNADLERRKGFRVEADASASEATEGPELPSPQAREQTFGLLSEPSRLKRMRALCDLLAQMDSENYSAIRSAFVRQTQLEGRTHDFEWQLMLEQVGAAAGRKALDQAVASKEHPYNARLQLRGWAAANPREARAWFESQTPEVQSQLAPGIMAGMAQGHPVEAITFGLSLPTETANSGIRDMIEQVIQQGGFRAAEEALGSLKGRDDVELQTRRNVAYWVSTKKLSAANLRGDPTEPLRWAEGYLSENSILGPSPIRDFVGAAAKSDPAMAIQWLDKNDPRLQPDQAQAAYGALAATLVAKDPQQLEKWFVEHQSHPFRDEVAMRAATQLIESGRPNESSSWIERIEEPNVKARAEALRQSRSPRPASFIQQ